MRKSYIKRIISITMSLTMILSGLYMINPAATTSNAAGTENTGATEGRTKKAANKSRITPYVPGEAIISLELAPGADSELIHEGALPSDRTITVKHVMDFGKAEKKSTAKKTYIVSLKTGKYTASQLVNKLKKYKNVKIATKNHCKTKQKMSVQSDPLFSNQWYLGGDAFINNNSTYKHDATLNYSPEEKEPTEKDVPVVAVVDDGVDYEHEDLKNVMWVNPFGKKKLPGKHGYDCMCDDDDPMPYENQTHGTEIAGVIAAENNNGIGIAGISKHARIMALRIYDDEDNNDLEAELMAYEYIYKALKLGVNIVAVNCSFGYPASDEPSEVVDEDVPLVNAAIKNIGKAGALMVYAAGNEGQDTDVYKYGTPQQYDHKYVVSVGATNYYGEIASFSNYGKNTTDLFAPGENILTTTHTHQYIPDFFTAEEKKEKCTIYDNFDTPGTGFKTIDQITGKETPFIKVSHSKHDFYGNKNGGSYEVYFEKKKNPTANAYCLYYDVTSLNLKPEENLNVSFCNSYYESDHSTIEWDTLSQSLQKAYSTSIFTYGSKTYLCIDLRKLNPETTQKIGTTTHFDNLSISKPVPDEQELGQYNYVDGTSFSAPIVAGAVARLAVLYPDDDAVTRKARLLKSVAKHPQYEDTCISGGILDLSKLADS